MFSKNFEDFVKTKRFPSTDDNQVTNQNFSIHPDEVFHWKGRIQGKNIGSFFLDYFTTNFVLSFSVLKILNEAIFINIPYALGREIVETCWRR